MRTIVEVRNADDIVARRMDEHCFEIAVIDRDGGLTEINIIAKNKLTYKEEYYDVES